MRRIVASLVFLAAAAGLSACGGAESPTDERPSPTASTLRPVEPPSPGDSGIPWGQPFATPVGELRIDEPRRVEVSDEAIGAGEGKNVVGVAVRYVNNTNQPVDILTDLSVSVEQQGVRLGAVEDPHGACTIPLGEAPPGRTVYWETCSHVNPDWKVMAITWKAGGRSGKAQVSVP